MKAAAQIAEIVATLGDKEAWLRSVAFEFYLRERNISTPLSNRSIQAERLEIDRAFPIKESSIPHNGNKSLWLSHGDIKREKAAGTRSPLL